MKLSKYIGSRSVITVQLFAILVLSAAKMTLADERKAVTKAMEINSIYHGFKLTQIRPIKEIAALGKLFTHEKSGAQLLKIESDDDNKTFCISFGTPPENDAGLPHILEHSVLNGSRNFPAKSPFSILSKGSLNTFLNAMTYADRTSYPVASQNAKDFRNLMHVYLDAVLYPKIYEEPMIFMQEGWHYKLDHDDGELTYNGIVYNEMKGAFSSPERYLFKTIPGTLFPDSPYGYVSGGFPEAIPELTSEQFLDFHRKFYEPSNAYIYLYGDGDTLSELEFIDKNYLSAFTKKAAPVAINLQKPFKKIKEVVASYPVAVGGAIEKETFLTMAFVTGTGTEPQSNYAFDILADALVNVPSAPIREALIEAGIGKDMYASYWDIKQPVFMIVVKNAEESDRERFKKIVNDTLKKIVKKGIDQKLVEGIINRLEFQLREADFGGYPKGLVYHNAAIKGWMYENDPFLTLEYEKPLTALKQSLKKGYLEKLIDTHLLKNPHGMLGVVKPERGLDEQLAEKTKEKLAKFKATLSPDALKQLVATTKALKVYQETPDTPAALASIPMLAREDLDAKVEKLDVKISEVAGSKVVYHETFANDIVYLKLIFDSAVVPQDKLGYLSLMTSLFGELSTEKYTYGQLDTELNTHTGGISFNSQNLIKKDDNQKLLPRFIVSSKAFDNKFSILIELKAELLLKTRFDDKKRLKTLLEQRYSQLKSRIKREGMDVATARLGSYMSPLGAYNEHTEGLTYYYFIEELATNFDQKADEIIQNLKEVSRLIFARQNLTIGLTCSKEDCSEAQKRLPALLARFDDKKRVTYTYEFPKPTYNEGIQAAATVQYVVKGSDFKKLGYEYSGKMQVLAQIMGREYLHNRIREQGGAYGAWFAVSRTGVVYYASYRDPNLTKTLDSYKLSSVYLKEFEASDREMTRFIIGTISKKDRPMSVADKGTRSIYNYLMERTQAERQKERDEILATTTKDIRDYHKMIAELLKTSYITVYGNEQVLIDNQGLFGRLIHLDGPVAEVVDEKKL